MEERDTTRPTGIVAFLFTDIEDSTRRWEHDPDAMAADLARHLVMVEDIAARHGGTRAPEHGAGDSTVTAFVRASDALAAAVDLQVALQECAWEGVDPLRVRVAVHAGEVMVDWLGAYAGPTLNRCGRLLQAAHGGQILASATAIELGSPAVDVDVGLVDLGRHHLRGIDVPVAIVQVDPPGSTLSFPPLRTPTAAGSTLPHPDSSLVGRRDDVASLAELIAGHRVVTVVGAGGCGKTRLAIEVAHEVLGTYAHGAVWVDLAPVAFPEAVLGTAAAATGLHTTGAISPGQLAAHLADRSMVLVLDNCEHVVAEVAALVTALESACPNLRILATSREPLALKDEVVWRVPSLAVPLSDSGPDLLDSDAGRLLVERIRRVRPGYEPDAIDAAALAAVCRQLDGIPLALELAAARAASIPPVELAARLSDRFALLAGGARDVMARQRTLEASVAWSYQLLDDDERCTFRRLSAFTGSFPLRAAVALCSDQVGAEDSVLRLLQCSLLVEGPAPDVRLRMLEPVRWFARERLIESGEADAILGRHLDWCVDAAQSLGGQLEGPAVRAALGVLDLELDNLRTAMQWAVGRGRGLDAARIIASTTWFWIWRGRIAEASRWLDRCGAETDEWNASQLALLWARAELTVNAAAEPARPVLERGREMARALGDERMEARFDVSGSRHLAFNDPHAVIEHAPEVRARCLANGERFWAAVSLVSEALAQITLGRFDLAEPLLDELRHEAKSLGHPQLVADEIARRALVDRRFGRYDDVQRAVVEIDAVTMGFTELNSQALVLAQAALVDVAQARAQKALDDMEILYRRYLVAGELSYVPSIGLPLMEALIDLDRPREARDRFEPLWGSFRQSLSWRLRWGSVRGLALLASGDTGAATAAFEDVLDVANATPNEHEAAIAERFLAAIDREQHRYADAEARLYRALEVQSRLGYPQFVADVLEDLGGIELDHDREQSAAIMFGAASTIRAGSGLVRRVGRQHVYEADLAALRSRLDAEPLRESWARGAALSMHDAVEYARRGRGERRRPTVGWESLTATETKVAALVAEGLTNPEIAHQLIMGRATVKTHVSNILRKLGLTNRTQVAAAMAHRGSAIPGAEWE